MRTLRIDLETYSGVDLQKSGLYKYVESADFQILLFAYVYDDEPVQIVDIASGESLTPQLINDLRNPDIIKKAYNAAFEYTCISKYMNLSLDQWRCTMVHAMYYGYPAGLAAVGDAIGIKQEAKKLSAGKALIKLFCTPCTPTSRNGQRLRTLPHHEPEKWQLFKEYCKQDVVAEREIDYKLSGLQVPEAEWQLWRLDQMINAYGVAVDTKLVEGAIYCDEKASAALMSEAVQITGISNPKSVQQLAAWLTEETGEEVTDLTKANVTELMAVTNGRAKRILEIRQELAKTSTKKYQAMAEAVCKDGRIRGLLQFYGANRTGRWAGRLVQVHNLPRNYLKTLSTARDLVRSKKVEALKLVYGKVPDTLSQLIRTAFIPAPGNVFLVADFSAIEARVIAWLAGEQWRLDVFATHGKIYEASAAAMFGVDINSITKESDLRQKGKVAELALGYQGSSGALIQMGALNMGLSEDELPEIVRRWRSANKRIVDLWYSIENIAVEVIRSGAPTGIRGLLFAHEKSGDQRFLAITLPSRRKLYYAKPFLAANNLGRGDSLYYYGMNQETKKWERIPTYGGKLVENIVQAIARDCLAESLVNLSNACARIAFHVHDEVVIEVPADSGEFLLKATYDRMGEEIAWAPGLQLKADGFITEFYKKD